MSTGAPEEEPLLRVVAGNPTDEEVAALTAVVLAMADSAEFNDRRHPGRAWLRRTLLRLHPLPGPGSWRRSGR
ncbi:acyl-CoA carboxylase subunit epsilon [Arthrobacter zhaoguopingii]|uniref:acyl-CoA carboxylase subunit epsilon n=1 Tax=Arthrobacter zhaoguopingii TaxID=2681491 RepID=UPI00135B0540|nr:acyl-CoA carboxylase subunit epsilon [Arthrobacter zhaoguopingii]